MQKSAQLVQPNNQFGESEALDWYSHVFVKFEMVKLLQNKYMSYMFFDNVINKWRLRRYFFGYSLNMMNNAFQKIKIVDKCRFYGDLAYWNQMLAFSWDVNKRRMQKSEWEILKLKYISGFDFALDFDSANADKWIDSYKECKKVLGYFDAFKIPYSVCWSGCKGFHVRIYDKYFPKWKSLTKVKRYLEIAKYLTAKLKCKTIDLAIYDMDRILKLPYSVDSKSGLVVLPLDEVQFDNFYPSLCYPSNVIRQVMIKNRGMCERIGNSEAVKRFCAEVF